MKPRIVLFHGTTLTLLLDHHIAAKTPAYTKWFILTNVGWRDIMELPRARIVDNDREHKTHHTIALTLDISEPRSLMRVRRSNRGNYHVHIYEVRHPVTVEPIAEYHHDEAIEFLITQGLLDP